MKSFVKSARRRRLPKWLGGCCADRRRWLSRPFRLGRGRRSLRTGGLARCCRSQKNSTGQNLYLRLPPALPHDEKNAARGRSKIHSQCSIGGKAVGGDFLTLFAV